MITARNKDKKSTLFLAAESNHPEIVKVRYWEVCLFDIKRLLYISWPCSHAQHAESLKNWICMGLHADEAIL